MLFLFVYFVHRQQTFLFLEQKLYGNKKLISDVPFSTTYVRKPVRRFNGSFLKALTLNRFVVNNID